MNKLTLDTPVKFLRSDLAAPLGTGSWVVGEWRSLMNDDNPVYVMLIGVPGSGKSTFIKQYFDDKLCHEDYLYYSSDAEIEALAYMFGKTYNEIFSSHIAEVTGACEDYLVYAFEHGMSVFDDHTNISAKKRKAKLNKVPDDYTKIAFVFGTPEYNEWRRRLDGRPGKTIPNNVLESMLTNYTNPSYDEGFDIICYIQ